MTQDDQRFMADARRASSTPDSLNSPASNSMAVAAVALAALLLIAGGVLFFLGRRNPAAVLFWLGIIPLVVGLFGLLRANETYGVGRNLAAAGIGLSVLSLVLGVLALVLPDRHGLPGSDVSVTQPGEQPTPVMPTGPASSIDDVIVSGPAGSEPTVEFSAPLRETEQQLRLIDPGNGAPLEMGQQLTVNMAGWRGDTGERLGSTWEEGLTENILLGSPDFEMFTEPLANANVGARVLWAEPTDSPGEDGLPVTLLWLIEVEDAVTVPTRAEGTPITPDPGLPVVTLAADGAPTIDIPADFDPSDELVIQTLIEGTGPVVQSDDTITVHYTGWLLDGTAFDSSWERGTPAWFPLDMVIPGWTQGLAGQHVGSQVLLIIPPEFGYEDRTDIPSIPPGSTLIFVVDILSVE